MHWQMTHRGKELRYYVRGVIPLLFDTVEAARMSNLKSEFLKLEGVNYCLIRRVLRQRATVHVFDITIVIFKEEAQATVEEAIKAFMEDPCYFNGTARLEDAMT